MTMHTITKALRSIGLPRARYTVLDNGASAAIINAVQIEFRNSRVQEDFDALCNDGFLQRTGDDSDCFYVTLTEAGVRAFS